MNFTEIVEDTNDNWIELCEYVKKEILCYDDEMKFPTFLAQRLRGMKVGQYIANKKQVENAKYSNQCLLLTFMKNKIYLNNVLTNNKSIKDEKHRINYMLAIIDGKVNDAYLQLKKIKQTKETVENIDTGIFSSQAEYKKTTNADDKKSKSKENFAKDLL